MSIFPAVRPMVRHAFTDNARHHQTVISDSGGDRAFARCSGGDVDPTPVLRWKVVPHGAKTVAVRRAAGGRLAGAVSLLTPVAAAAAPARPVVHPAAAPTRSQQSRRLLESAGCGKRPRWTVDRRTAAGAGKGRRRHADPRPAHSDRHPAPVVAFPLRRCAWTVAARSYTPPGGFSSSNTSGTPQ